MTNTLLWKMAIEIVDIPMKNGASFHSYVTKYQRVPKKVAHIQLLRLETSG